MQSLIDLSDNKFSRGDYEEDKARILFTSSTSTNLIEVGYVTFDAKKTFNLLQGVFIQALIFQYFDQEWHIQTKTKPSDYAIGRIVSELIFDNSN